MTPLRPHVERAAARGLEPLVRAAATASIAASTLRLWAVSGRVRAERIGGAWYIDPRSLAELLEPLPGRDPSEETMIAVHDDERWRRDL